MKEDLEFTLEEMKDILLSEEFRNKEICQMLWHYDDLLKESTERIEHFKECIQKKEG